MAILTVNARSVTSSFAFARLAEPSPFTSPPAGSQEGVTVTLFDKNMIPRMPIQFTSLTATLYYNAVGSWALIAPYSQDLWNATMSGDFTIEVDWRGLFKFGGKCEQPGYQDSIPGTGGSSGTAGPYIVLSGADYLALVANRIAYPDPGHSWVGMNKANMDVATNQRLESVIKGYVIVNMCSGGALSNRVMPFLDTGPDLARGNLISYTIKFTEGVNLNLLDALRLMIVQGSGPTGMGMYIYRNGNRLVFEVYIPRDLSKKAWFSEQLGNLTSISFSLTDPTVTNALVNGGGTVLVEKVAASRTVWNVSESYVDQTSETDANNLNAVAQQTLLSGGYGPLLSATVVDTPFLSFGRDYYLGDIVTIEVTPGNSFADVVTSVDLAVAAGGDPVYSVIPKIGHSGDATSTDQSIIGQLSARIRKLEKNVNIVH